MLSRKRSVQARRQERDDHGKFKRASSTSSDSSNGGDDDGSGDGVVVKKCGHKYCVSPSFDSGGSGVRRKGHGASSSGITGGAGRKIRNQKRSAPPRTQFPRASPSSGSSDGGVRFKAGQDRSAPSRRQFGRAYSSSGSSDENVGIAHIDLSSASSENDAVKQGIASPSLRRPASGDINKKELLKQKAKERVMDQVPLQNICSLQQQVEESEARITTLVGQLESEKRNRRALQRALLEANNKSSKK